MRRAMIIVALASLVFSHVAIAQAVTMRISQPSAPSDSEKLIASEEGEALAETIRQAIAAHDPQPILDSAKWDGVLEEHREIFCGFVARLVEIDIEGVTLRPPGLATAPFEHEGETFAKNGEIAGQVAVSFVVEPPSVSEYLLWPYGIENGRAVILLDAPAAAPAAE